MVFIRGQQTNETSQAERTKSRLPIDWSLTCPRTHTYTHNTPALDAVWKLYCREAAVVDAAADSCDSPRAPREGKEEEGGGR